MLFRPSSVLYCALVLLLYPARLGAQTTTSGGLTGVVSDPSHGVVPDASVEIRDSSKGTIQTAKTDIDGVYRFFFVAPGSYTLTLSHAGFREDRQTISVQLGPAGTRNITLKLAGTSATVKVTDEVPLLQAENGDVSTTMSRKQITEVPNPGNDLTYIAQTAPGVVMNTDVMGGANFSILGMPGTSYLYTVDGMNDNDNFNNLNHSGALGLLLGQNQIEEVTVVSTGYSGQFGGAAGGNINYITKSGSNEFHGNAQYYWNGRAFNANDWFLKAFGQPRFFEIANQWAGSLGGPIKKDKLFFFFDTEGIRLQIPTLANVEIPTPQFEAATLANIDTEVDSSGHLRFGPNSATDEFYRKIFDLYNAAPGASSTIPGNPGDPLGCPGFSDPTTKLGISVPCSMYFTPTRSRPSQDTLTSGRMDWNVSSSDRAFFRLQYENGRNAAGTDLISPLFDVDFTQPSWQGQIMETHTFGASAASQFLLAGSYFAPIFREKNPSQALAAFPTELIFNSNIFSCLGCGSGAAFGFGAYNTQFQISEDVVKTRGNQKFGFGASFTRTLRSELPNKSGVIGGLVVQTLDAFYQGGVDPASPKNDFTSLFQSFISQTSVRITSLNFGLYGQDEWHARPNLTLTLAMRAEHYSNPACQNRCFVRLAGPFESLSHDPSQPYNQAILINQRHGVQEIDSILWSPRFSFAWQPFGVSHNTVIRGGIGLFYDPVPGGAFDFSSNPPLVNSYTASGDNLAPNETSNLFKDAAASNAAFVNGLATGQTLAQIQAAVSSVNPNGFFPPGITAAEHTLHSPQYQPVPPCADPRFSGVTELQTNAVSNYNGMVVSFEHRFTRWTQGLFQVNYAYGKALDEVSNGGLFSFTFASSGNPQDPNNLRGAYGPAEYDVRHSLNANYVWEVPVKAALRGHGWDSLVKGWQISGTIFARTGLPYTVFDFSESGNLQQNNYFGALYAVPVGPLGPQASCGKAAATPPGLHPCLPPQLLADNVTPNPSALFVQAGCETGFNAGHLPGPNGPCGGPIVTFAQGRNHFRGPSYFNTDFAIMKNTKIPRWENATLGIGFQFFNLFNHTNFQYPVNGISDQIFGLITNPQQPPTSILGSSVAGDVSARMIQLKAQLRF